MKRRRRVLLPARGGGTVKFLAGMSISYFVQCEIGVFPTLHTGVTAPCRFGSRYSPEHQDRPSRGAPPATREGPGHCNRDRTHTEGHSHFVCKVSESTGNQASPRIVVRLHPNYLTPPHGSSVAVHRRQAMGYGHGLNRHVLPSGFTESGSKRVASLSAVEKVCCIMIGASPPLSPHGS